MASELTPIGRTFLSASVSIGGVIDLGMGGETRVWEIVPSMLSNVAIKATESTPRRPLFETAGSIVVRVAAHDPPGSMPRVNTKFHVLRFKTLGGIVTITGGFSFPLTLKLAGS